MPLTKKQWLNQTVMCDEWGRPPSLADVPLTYMSRDKAFEKQSKNFFGLICQETKSFEMLGIFFVELQSVFQTLFFFC